MTVAGPLRSAEARQALCWAFPYDDVIDGVLRGSPSGRSARWPSSAGASIRTRLSTPPISTVHVRCCNAPGSRRARRSPTPSRWESGGHRDRRAFCDQPRGARTSARHPGHRLRDVHRPLLRGAPRGGAPKPLFLFLVAGLQRRLESPVAPSFLRGLAGGQCWAVLQRARRSVTGGGENRHRPGALFRGAGGDPANRHSRRSGRDLRRSGPVADRATPRSGWVRPEFDRSRDHRFLSAKPRISLSA